MPEFAKDDHFVATLIAGAAVMLGKESGFYDVTYYCCVFLSVLIKLMLSRSMFRMRDMHVQY